MPNEFYDGIDPKQLTRRNHDDQARRGTYVHANQHYLYSTGGCIGVNGDELICGIKKLGRMSSVHLKTHTRYVPIGEKRGSEVTSPPHISEQRAQTFAGPWDLVRERS